MLLKAKNALHNKFVKILLLTLLVFTVISSVTAYASDIVGDVNNDGKANTKDAMLIARIAAEIEIVPNDIKMRCDATHDGVVDVKDLTYVQIAINYSLYLA